MSGAPRPVLILGDRDEEPLLLRELTMRLGLRGAQVSAKDVHGRPTLSQDDRPLAFSRSRAGRLCALALAREGRVGVDLVAKDERDCEPLAALFPSPERARLAALPKAERRDEILRRWAAREAVLKALGLGLALGPEAIELAEEGPTLRLARIVGQRAEGWHLDASNVEGHVLALAWTE